MGGWVCRVRRAAGVMGIAEWGFRSRADVGHRSCGHDTDHRATALAFVPAVILVMTIYRARESFPVMLRKDYLTLLNCVLFSMAAAFLPLTVLGRFFCFGQYICPGDSLPSRGDLFSGSG